MANPAITRQVLDRFYEEVAHDREKLKAFLRPVPLDLKKVFIRAMNDNAEVKNRRCYYHLFPDETKLWQGTRTQVFKRGLGEVIWARHYYPQHMAFFAAGLRYRERCFMAANRVGKTIGGGFEDAAHATGDYPTWWPGRRFTRPVSMWICGRTNETTRDILQAKLFGKVVFRGGRKTVDGTGIFPVDCLGQPTWKSGVQDLIDTIPVLHKSGGWSDIGLKSYEQGRKAFEGTEKDVVHCDEEPPAEAYDEMLIRTTTTGGIVYLTFTPLEGYSTVVQSFLPKPEGSVEDDGEFDHNTTPWWAGRRPEGAKDEGEFGQEHEEL